MKLSYNHNSIEDEPLKILVIDDDKANLSLISKILSLYKFKVVTESSGEAGLGKLSTENFDVILLDVMMPGIDGYEICKRIKECEETRLIPVIILTALNSREDRIKGIEAGCEDFISKPLDKTELVTRIRALGKVKRLNDELDMAESVLLSLARAVEAKDDTTGRHCDRLIQLSKQFGQFLELSKMDLKILERASVLHDVGKIGMPDSILLKEGDLTLDEWAIVKRHPIVGEEICKPLRTLKDVSPIIRTHHERWNGTGYPDGLKEEEIPFLSRVFQILDAFDALTTKRPYKKAINPVDALQILKSETDDGLWDPKLIKKFLSFFEFHKMASKDQ